MNIEFESRNESSVSIAGISVKEALLITGCSLKAHSLAGTGLVTWGNGEELVNHLSISRDERSLATSSSNVIKLLDLGSGRETRRMVDHKSGVTCISSFSRSPYQWISGDDEGVCRISDARRHPSTLITLRQSRPVRCVYSSPDDSLIVIGDDSSLQLYDLRQRQLLSRFIHSTTGVAFHKGERLMASFGDESVVRYWDLDTLECVSQSEPFIERLVDAHFSFQGDSLVVCSADRVRCLTWEPCTVEWSHVLPSPSSVLSSHLDQDDKLRIITTDPLNNIKVFASPLTQMESLSRGSNCEDLANEVSPVEEFQSNTVSFASPNADVILLNTRNQEERSLRVVSHSPQLHSTPSTSKSSVSNTNKLTKATSRLNLEDEKKKKVEERKSSMKRKEGKSSVDIMSMIDMDHSSVMDDLNGAASSLRAIKDAFRRGNLVQVIEAWTRDRNAAVLSAFCRQCCCRNRWNLSLSLAVLPHLPLLLSSIHRELRGSAIFALSSIVNAVGELVHNITRNGVPSAIGVDVAAEDRLRMCKSIEKELVLIQLRENEIMKVMGDDERTQFTAILALFPT